MHQDIRKILFSTTLSQPEAGFLSKVILAIHERERKSAERRLFLHLAVSFSAMFVFYYYLASTIASLNEAGFWQYLSLLFSDFSVIISSWQSYLLSLLEVLPVTGFIILLSALLIILNSVKYFTEALLTFINLRNIKQQNYVQ